jgi:hypothetical protein
MTLYRDFEWNLLVKENGIRDDDMLNCVWDSDGLTCGYVICHTLVGSRFASPRATPPTSECLIVTYIDFCVWL